MSSTISLACIIDDDTMYVSLIRRIILAKNLCQNLMVFHNGKSAFDYFQVMTSSIDEKNIPEIIFLDINMPVMNGWEFLERYTSIENKLKKASALYVVSSSINPVDINRAKNNNAVKDYIVKPVTIADLESIFSRKHN
ncbi:response regulator [Aquimarina sp. U1-2]|uniref:response regulator n=1 Tax=Aquimarina sp. U1-2 TaxID=2823141 RepID=UPI001AEC966A|nr:response regulator [Aquimarina sp. U1-2]MBP2831160.1 response regulator [Aquimarina sp. U1-2]